MKDWQEWHRHYDMATSPLNQRLALVQAAIRRCLPDKPTTNYTILDICAGDGRDLISVLSTYKHKDLLHGLLVELDPRLVSESQERAHTAQIPDNLKIIQGDASQTHTYKNNIPADLILVCGVFGNISDNGVARTIKNLPKLSKQGTHIIWTRNRRNPDHTEVIRSLFNNNGFDEIDFASTSDGTYSVGIHTFNTLTPNMGDNVTMFNFINSSFSSNL